MARALLFSLESCDSVSFECSKVIWRSHRGGVGGLLDSSQISNKCGPMQFWISLGISFAFPAQEGTNYKGAKKRLGDFYSWNRVKLRYCDGASFGGDVEDENQGSSLYFRGQRIWHAMIDDLLTKGMNNVEQALLSGCSAGGLATFLHCDNFRELLPKKANVKCLSDAGFFLDAKDISGAYHIRSFFKSVVTLQGVQNNLPKACTTSQLDPTQCFFPQYLLLYIKTPIFILNAAYDTWQFHNILVTGSADPHGHWHYCKLNPTNCTSSQLEILQGYRNEMLKALEVFKGSTIGGIFINSCFAHCQSERQDTWFETDSPRFNNKTIAQAVGDWYFDRSVVKEIDCPYPCDKTCHNLLPSP